MYEAQKTYGERNATMDKARKEARALVEPNIFLYGDRDGSGRGVGVPGGGRRNINDEPCDIDDEMSGPGFGEGGGRGEGLGRR